MKITTHRHWIARRFISAMLWTSAVFVVGPVDARGLQDVRVSKVGARTTIEIELSCPMRYTNYGSTLAGTEVRLQMVTAEDCVAALRGTWNELRRPAAGRMASLSEIEFERGKGDQATITLRFDKAVGVEIQQARNPHMLAVVIDTSTPTPLQQATPLPAEAAALPESKPPVSSGAPGRQVRRPPSAGRNRFVIRVAVLSEAEDPDFRELRQFDAAVVYTNEVFVGERRWAEVRLGFFDSEAEAQQALTRLGSRYASAWITVANPEEQARAREQLFQWPDAQAADNTSDIQVASTTVKRPAATLTSERVEAMLVEARAALLRRDFVNSIEIYTRLLEEPGGDYRREARELLGVALEKNGQLAHARAEYEAFLEEYPTGPGTRRVQQRLAALSVPVAPVAATTGTAEPAETAMPWEFYGGVSQYYLRGVNVAEDEEPDFISQSALLSQTYFYARRQGERFDVVGRANLGYLRDLVENGTGNQGLVSYAYVDVTDLQSEFAVRLGRQRQLSGGVLASFDGVHSSYRLRPDLTVNVTAGFPVDSPRFRATTDHYFYGASVELDDVAGTFDVGVFANLQTVDGIPDRQALGGEVQYRKGGFNFVGMVDYDASYNVLNTGLVTSNWRINDRLTLYGRFRGGAAPFLTTRNAIIGQPVNTVRELFSTYSEGQIRRLARNRTAEERAGSAGLTATLTPRLKFKAEVAYAEYSSTVTSGGVDALPETGPQHGWGGHLIGSGFLKPGQLFMVGYRHDETRSVDTDTVWFDLRHPIGERLRIQTRLSVANRVANQDPAGDIEQLIANPVLRVLYAGGPRYRIEFEIGGQWSNREFPDALAPPLTPENEYDSTDYYAQLGYSLDF